MAQERTDRSKRTRERRLEKAVIQASPEDCLAYLINARECAVDVAAFDSRVAWHIPEPTVEPTVEVTNDQADTLPVLPIRAETLEDLLDQTFQQHLAESRDTASGSADEPDRPNQRDPELGRIYLAYRDMLFKGSGKRSYRALAATDSSMLDSFAREARRSRKATGSWPLVASEALPPEIRAVSDSLRPAECAGPKWVGYGYLAVCLQSVERSREIPFRRALPLLKRLRSLGFKGPGRSEKEVGEYYRVHLSEFVSPDTIDLTVWVSPALGGRTIRNGAPESACDTICGVPGIPLRPSRLPAMVAERMPQGIGNRLGAAISLGRIAFGDWIVRADRTKPGAGFLSLEAARPRIVGTLDAIERAKLEAIRRETEQKDQEAARGEAKIRASGDASRDNGASLGRTESESDAYARIRNDWLAKEIRVDSALLRR